MDYYMERKEGNTYVSSKLLNDGVFFTVTKMPADGSNEKVTISIDK